MMRLSFTVLVVLALTVPSSATDPLILPDAELPGTSRLVEQRPLDEVMVAGIDRFALRELQLSRQRRANAWQPDYRSLEQYEASLAPARQRLAEILGVVDQRVPANGIQYLQTTESSSKIAEHPNFRVDAVRWPVLDGITAEGLFLRPKVKPIARIVAIPDATWTPEMIAGMQTCDSKFAADLAGLGCEVLIPTIISRKTTFSANPSIGRSTNLTHREFLYRQSFELGRHVIGYEIQKVLAAIDQFALRNKNGVELPIGVVGVGDGGMLALYSGALDARIRSTVVSGFVDEREKIWKEPIDRNVWNLLTEFGDSDVAGLIAPRALFIEHSPKVPEVTGPPPGNRNIAARGVIRRPSWSSSHRESKRARSHWERLQSRLGVANAIHSLDGSQQLDEPASPLSAQVLAQYISKITDRELSAGDPAEITVLERLHFSTTERQGRQVKEIVAFNQRLLQLSHRVRDQTFDKLDRRSVETWTNSANPIREDIYDRLIGRIPNPTVKPEPRSRVVIDDPEFRGYEVVLNVFPDVIASGVLLLPKDLKQDERRPVVVCQHGLEGRPSDTYGGPETQGYRAYKAFAAELARRGFIVYAPQNPYRGQDAFRTLQRKSNPLGRSLFSYIIPQHLVTLRWLASLDYVDADRIAFYGLSYGGKTAMRVPPLLPPTEDDPGYCLSICSADFNEWVAKNASTDAPFSYIWTGEYEIFEWNMAHVANYAELAMLMTPRPFMVERGHDDGVGIDEWVAWEYAKVRRHYNRLGIGDRTEIEFFNGPHTIHGQGTYRFLEKHLSFGRDSTP